MSTQSPFQPAEQVKCDRYYTERNRTHIIYGGYEGIPENLLINFVIWVLLLVLFTFLRKIAWDYGRLALVSRAEARWTSLFYGNNTNLDARGGSQESLDTQVHRQDKGFCAWIPAFFRIKDEHILVKSGKDAVQYLTFQRYLICYMALVTLFSIAIILPINFQGDLEGDTQSFGHTTISNMKANAPLLWVHAILAVLFLVIAVIFMRRFSTTLEYEDDEQASRTLMISNIPKDKCFKNTIQQHFRDAYPEAPVEDITFAYNITKLMKLDKNREWALEGLMNSEAIHRQSGERPLMVPYPCGQCSSCCTVCGCEKVDAIDYYSHHAASYRNKCEAEKVNAFQEALGIAFVTFEDDNTAAKVNADFSVSCKGAHNPHPSSVSRELSVHNWEVCFAPHPANIHWENLSLSEAVWWMKAITINFFLVILLFFLTTPSIIMNLMNADYQRAIKELHNPLIVQFAPTLLLVFISALLPNIVYWSDQFIGHWTRSAEHHSIMRKCYIFLLLMVLILPSLGLTSAKALIEWFAARDEEAYKFRWECIFIPDNGAFFVNYVITAAFIGTAAELVRIPELVLYSLKLLLARSAAERTSVRKSVIWDFQFGSQYAWMLSVYSVVMAYSIVCPLITPFGLVYLVMKHLSDRYNIYFTYAPSKIDRHIHTSAVNFVIVGVILLQFVVVFFSILRTERVQGITVFSVIALFFTLVIFFGRVCFGWFKGLSPIKYKQYGEGEQPVMQQQHDSTPFVPNVLLQEQQDDSGQSNHGNQTSGQPNSNASYGSTGSPTNTPEHTAKLVP